MKELQTKMILLLRRGQTSDGIACYQDAVNELFGGNSHEQFVQDFEAIECV